VREVALVEREVRLWEGGECWWAGRDVDAEDVGAGCEEGGCCGEADAGGGAGYYYGFAFEVVHDGFWGCSVGLA
jgi:hypothetical protein